MPGSTVLKRLCTTMALAGALIAAPAAAAPTGFDDYSGIYIFGDSLVDSGNAKKAANTFDFFLPGIDDPAPTAAGYYKGRFSNGYNYADRMSLAVTGKAAKPVFPYGFPLPIFGQIRYGEPSGNNLNFGYGGAQIIQGSENVPSLRGQLDAYKSLPGPADPNALYVLNFGGNDLFQVIDKNYSVADTAAYLSRIAGRMADQAARLEAMGAQHILIAGPPDIGLVPKYSPLSDLLEISVRRRATAAAEQLDRKLEAALAALDLSVDFTADLDLFSFLDFTDEVMADPNRFGLPATMNWTDQCVLFRKPDAYGNINCTGFAYFDRVHPTSGIHRAIYQAIKEQMFPTTAFALAQPAAVETPEPAGAALLGLGLAGLVAARRRARAGRAT
jgi:phospholipase/lecithinase/hemolysin